jgi:hypothetical protein
VRVVAAPGAKGEVAGWGEGLLTDDAGAFRRAYGDAELYLVRPDKYLGFRSAAADVGGLEAHLRSVFRSV